MSRSVRAHGRAPGRGAAPRWACCAATIRTCSTSSHAKAAGRQSQQFQHFGRRHPMRFSGAVAADGTFELVHAARARTTQIAGGAASARRMGSGLSRRSGPTDLWQVIKYPTPTRRLSRVLFPTGSIREQPALLRDGSRRSIPAGGSRSRDHGCCCLGSIDLPRLRHPIRSSRGADSTTERFEATVRVRDQDARQLC